MNQSDKDDADDWFGRDGYGDGYFDDILDVDEPPDPRSALQGDDDTELKSALRDTLGVRMASAKG